MSTNLSGERCTACHKDAPRVTGAEIAELKPLVPEWEIIEVDGVPRLERSYRFSSYPAALAFTQAVGEAAEREDHHPAILTEARRVRVTWWTHAIRNLHRNDFIMAAKTDEIASTLGANPTRRQP
jgi:4a-hydroxytetrahydrobiopterin dehydratase